MATDQEVSRQEPEKNSCCFPCLNRLDSDIQQPSAEVDDIRLELAHGIGILPDEVLTHILLFVPDEDLKHCLTVCRVWCNIILGQTLWRAKSIRNGLFIEELMAAFAPSDWRTFYFKAPYTRNLIRNCSGQDGLKNDWRILENGGNQWKVEKDHSGSDALPEEALALSNNESYNFATSYGWCSMEQVIDLLAEGIPEELLDGEVQPDILITEWYAARFDCGNTFEMSVTLLTEPKLEPKTTLDEFHAGPVLTQQWAPRNWHKVEHTFSDYGPGLRYIRFWHRGKDSQFWAGHYGSKMTGAQVRLQFKKGMKASKPSRDEVKNQEAQLILKEDDNEDNYD